MSGALSGASEGQRAFGSWAVLDLWGRHSSWGLTLPQMEPTLLIWPPPRIHVRTQKENRHKRDSKRTNYASS